MASIRIEHIDFHRNPGPGIKYAGPEGYTIPAGSSAATVTFQVNETDGRHIQLTELVRLPAKDYDDMVAKAWKRLKQRLEQLGELAHGIGTEPNPDAEPPA